MGLPESILFIFLKVIQELPLPLLLSFHELTGNMEFNFNHTNFNELAESENFIVVHPNGINKKWTLRDSNNPDIDFIELLLDKLRMIIK